MTRIQYEYPNGFRIVYEKSSLKTPITAYHILCNFGSNNEPTEDLYGSAHFIEHLCFKGSTKYKNLYNTKFFDKIGAPFNAFTTKKYTTYYTTCQDEFVKPSMLLFSEMLLKNKIKNGEGYNIEKNVVKAESLKNENYTFNNVIIEVEKNIYDGTVYSKPVDILTFHNAKNHLPYEKIVKLYKQYYVPQNMILSIVSNMSFNSVKKIVDNSYFTQNITPKNTPIISTPIIPYYKSIHTIGPNISTIYKKNNSNLTLSIGFKIDDYINLKDYYCLKLLEIIISKLRSSRLFIVLREKNGLIYSISSDIEVNEKGANGSFIIITETDNNNLYPTKNNKGVIMLIFNLFENLIKNGITIEELNIAKGNQKGTIFGMQNNINNISLLNGIDILYNCKKCVPIDKIYDTFYSKITCKDIHKVIKHYITRNNITICLLGNKLKYPEFEPFIINNLPF
jgi:predicted Zn-dependent peptidase